MLTVNAYFDGMMSPTNPDGFGCGGWWYESEGMDLKTGYGVYYVPGQKATNNMAEYSALIELLESLVTEGHNANQIVIRGDSQLTINQMLGTYKVASQKLKPLHQQAHELLRQFEQGVSFEWIPRDKNWRADQLAEEAYSRACARTRTTAKSPHSVELFEYFCDGCKYTYVMRLTEGTLHCIMCGAALRKRDFSMRNTPAGRVFYTLREAGYRTIMYLPGD